MKSLIQHQILCKLHGKLTLDSYRKCFLIYLQAPMALGIYVRVATDTSENVIFDFLKATARGCNDSQMFSFDDELEHIRIEDHGMLCLVENQGVFNLPLPTWAQLVIRAADKLDKREGHQGFVSLDKYLGIIDRVSEYLDLP